MSAPWDEMQDELWLHIASTLPAAALGRLACVAARFGRQTNAAAAGDGLSSTADGLSRTQQHALVSEAARRSVARHMAAQQGWVPRADGEAWLSVLRRLETLKAPRRFTTAHASLMLSQNGAVATKAGTEDDEYFHVAVSADAVMQAGCHCVVFTLERKVSNNIALGVIRPGWNANREPDSDGSPDDDEEAQASSAPGHCFYDVDQGHRFPFQESLNWQGMAGADEGDSIMLVLDLGLGSMTVYKNEELLGVMQESGLTAPLCWAMETMVPGNSVRIDGPIEDPTESSQDGTAG